MPEVDTYELRLTGCTPDPLMSYLKALGVFRLVAEQADPATTLSWHGGVASLKSKLCRDDLVDFFVERYKPTPIVAPWNGGSGFYSGGREPLELIANSKSDRLQLYRDTIDCIRTFVPDSKPKDDDKQALLIRCRSELSDEVIPWLDVCFVLGEERIAFFPLLGTGGNDGRLDFTNNFMQRLTEVMALTADNDQRAQSQSLLNAALFADTLVMLGKSAIGQFNPGGIGGANGRQGNFEAGPRVNAWDFVLMIEGALLFAGSAARRMGVRSGSRTAFPFSVESVAVGYGSAAGTEETTDGSRSEIWLPLWDDPCTLEEVRHLFSEGRAQIDRRQARNAVEFALAVNLLGVNRGVKSFARYGFLKRNGLAFLATPLGRVEVELRPKAHLLRDPPLTEWLERWRRACSDKEKTPARYQTALREIDAAIFAFANRSGQGNDARYLLNVLTALGNAEQTLSCGLRFAADKYLRPVQRLSDKWLEQADDGSPEFRLAVALAGISASKKGEVGPIRAYMEEVAITKFVDWSPGSTSTVWSNRPLATNLAAVFIRRQFEAFRAGLPGTPLQSPCPVRLDDVLAFLREGEIDEDKLEGLIWGLVGVNWASVSKQSPQHSHDHVPVEFGIPRLLVSPRRFAAELLGARLRWGLSNDREPNAKPEPGVFQELMSGRRRAVDAAVTRGARRLRSGGLTVVGYRNRRHAGARIESSSEFCPERLLAAMLFPLSNRDLKRIANSVLYPPEAKE